MKRHARRHGFAEPLCNRTLRGDADIGAVCVREFVTGFGRENSEAGICRGKQAQSISMIIANETIHASDCEI